MSIFVISPSGVYVYVWISGIWFMFCIIPGYTLTIVLYKHNVGRRAIVRDKILLSVKKINSACFISLSISSDRHCVAKFLLKFYYC